MSRENTQVSHENTQVSRENSQVSRDSNGKDLEIDDVFVKVDEE